MTEVRVRFAPSPTGFVHVGSLRTALYNYLFARHHHGHLVLRIEDTDQERYVEGAVENLIETLKWCGLEYDEGPDTGGDYGPYFQSQRQNIYQEHIEAIIEKGYAYPCFCSADRLEAMRNEQISQNLTPKYDGLCRKITAPEAIERRKTEKHVIRLKVPVSGNTVVQDMIRGQVVFQNELIDDQILLKSDGYPTYHLANVIDDHLMQISHVIRGEEWLISTPKHILLYRAFNWTLPSFAHLPLLLNPDRSKLSKRQGDVAVEDYRKKGYLPEALLNFVALLGWNRGDDQEIFSLQELIRDFKLQRINKSGAVFNLEKLNWMNALYIRQLTEDDYLQRALAAMHEQQLSSGHDATDKKIVLAVRNNLDTFADLKEKTAIFRSEDGPEYHQEAMPWIQGEKAKMVIETVLKQMKDYSQIDLQGFKTVIGEVQKQTGIKGKELWMPLRVALTGLSGGPELPYVIDILGKEKIMKFLEKAKNIKSG